MPGVWAVLVAAGRGDRLGIDRPKAFARLAGRPLLAESLERLESSSWIESIVIVAPPGWEEPAILLADELALGKAATCVTGGSTRADSVRAGLAAVPDEMNVVLVHDAARPLVGEDVIDRVIGGLGEAVVPALPVADTLKRTHDGRVVETLDRTGLHAVQTPQAFVGPILRDAMKRAGSRPGDCAAAVEAAGGTVLVVEGDPALLKVTTPADLAVVERLLARP